MDWNSDSLCASNHHPPVCIIVIVHERMLNMLGNRGDKIIRKALNMFLSLHHLILFLLVLSHHRASSSRMPSIKALANKEQASGLSGSLCPIALLYGSNELDKCKSGGDILELAYREIVRLQVKEKYQAKQIDYLKRFGKDQDIVPLRAALNEIKLKHPYPTIKEEVAAGTWNRQLARLGTLFAKQEQGETIRRQSAALLNELRSSTQQNKECIQSLIEAKTANVVTTPTVANPDAVKAQKAIDTTVANYEYHVKKRNKDYKHCLDDLGILIEGVKSLQETQLLIKDLSMASMSVQSSETSISLRNNAKKLCLSLVETEKQLKGRLSTMKDYPSHGQLELLLEEIVTKREAVFKAVFNSSN